MAPNVSNKRKFTPVKAETGPSKKYVKGDKAKEPVESEEEEEVEEEEDEEMGEAVSDDGAAGWVDEDAEDVEMEDGENGEQKPPKDPNASREAHKAQKVLAAERKANKPHADTMTAAKKIWEKLRLKKLPVEERKALVDEMLELTRRNVTEIIFKHDASRFIQTCLKYGSQEQRQAFAAALKGRYVEMSKSSYGKYTVIKCLHYGSAATRAGIFSEFYGNVRKLIRHKEAAYVLEDAFRDYGNTAQKNALLEEFYGQEFAVFKSEKNDAKTLAEILKANPEKKDLILRNLAESIVGSLKKGSIGFTIIHRALHDYMNNCNDAQFADMLDNIKENIAEVVHTKDGSDLAMLCFAKGTPKDRKVLVRALKPYAHKLAMDEYGCLVFCAIFETVDDTVLVNKSLLSELKPHLQEMMMHKYGRRVLLYILCGCDPRYFFKESTKMLDAVKEIRQTTSKKDPEVRRQELLSFISEPLLELIASKPTKLVEESLSSQVVTETLLFANGDKGAALDAILNIARESPVVDVMHPVNFNYASRVYKTLVSGGHWDPKENKIHKVEPRLEFESMMLPVVEKHLADWASSNGSYVVIALLETLEGEERERLVRKLRSHKAAIQAASKKDKVSGGVKKILEVIA
ncbi:puf family RNA-binding protein [Saitoella complicata NRRL Y-17804]|uniref:PUM-HD domain-containing protein n=1 Tax=Saitoella complicata (strain BCRC 22490 / CBS 7301 / JCM 7358 / NBRC 10748 / NRRL Y-17804) TaxID=698492 RepID=A0A0E9NN88_SAICN|nr:puf family RNA-binding protein [Saitoella complicata NRRL Y-17804]ODQ50399.1 puf family RNA-binding protein [Saitoella complicata NRRL Y-17804]GAO51151.1 hypothetical protein G7K_5262-t1 [Saitoella complicata NRRL Y-17804]